MREQIGLMENRVAEACAPVVRERSLTAYWFIPPANDPASSCR
jgi:hypothetical protein